MSDPPIIRIILEQSRQLDQAGAEAFALVGRGSYPDAAGRWVIHLSPAAWPAAVAAANVLAGTHKAVKIKPAKPATGSQ